jgi:putative ABC transport system permease protein
MSLWSRIRQSIAPTRNTSDIDEELALHMELRAEELEKQGLTKEQARREAAKMFGPRSRIVEETREAHSLQWLDNWRRDSAYSIRSLLRRPAFLTTGLATLALGIGVNVAIFSLLDGLLLKPLPVPDADRLMAFVETRNGDSTGGNPLRLKDYTDALRSLATTGGFYSEGMVVRTADGAQSLKTLRTVGDLATTFGYRPVLGRLPGPTEDNVALLGHRYWEQAYGASRDVLGKTLRTSSGTIEIIGVMPPEAALIEEYEVWTPMTQEMQKTPRTAGFLQMIGRLKPAVDLARANAELATVNAAMRAAHPEEDKGLTVRLTPLQGIIANEASRPVLLLAGVVFTVLLIACANLAGLLLARNADRAREAAIRLAIGASRGDLIRLYLLESVWLAIPGGALGLLVGAWSLAYLKSLLPADLPLLNNVAIDARVALFALGLTLFCALAIGLLPAWQVARLKAKPSPLRSVLVVAQVAVSMVLLMTAGLLVHSLMDAKKRPLGFNQDHVLALQFDFTWDTDNAKLQQFYHDVEQTVREVPGVRSAGLIDRLPLEGGSQGRGYLRIRGRNLEESLARQSYGYRAMTKGYITALRVPVLRGGLPDDKQPQTLINETFAKKYFGDTDPVGQQVSYSDANREPAWYTITGVVANVAQNSVEKRPFSEVFVPISRTFWPHAALVVNTEGDAAPVIAAARRVDPFAVIRYAGPLESRLATAWSEPQLIATLLGGFALAALALVCVGIYGMLAGFVRGRTREFGIRLALGATPVSLTQLSLNHGLRLTAIGLGLGLAGTWPVARFLDKSPDPVAMVVAASLMMAAAGVACYGPARRAAKLDPAMVLRHD